MRKNLNRLLIILIFLGFNFIFNLSLWKETFNSKVVISDNIITEYLVETSYQNILHFKNPFITNTILFPFTTNFSMNDPNTAYVLPFFVLRPLFDPHKSFLMITLFGFFLNNLFMYLLLRKLKIRQALSVIMALVFGFTPFLSHRILGHYTYIPIFFFPLLYLMVSKLFDTKIPKQKILISLGIGLLLALILLSNFYYFFMIILGILFYFSYGFFSERKKLLSVIKENIIYLILSILSATVLLIPWILSVYDLIKIQGLVKTPGFGGSVTLSSDVLSFFTPSEYNPIYKFIFSKLSFLIPHFSKYEHFYLTSWERFSYPGIIILATYLLIFIYKIFKKFPEKLWIEVKSHLIIGLSFSILMLGPFLKIFNRWMINLDGVALIVPLPFLLFHYIPGVATLRSSSRFTPAFVFFACIGVSYVLNFILNKISYKKRIILLTSLFFLFFVDQLYIIPEQIQNSVPTKIYNYLKNKKDEKTVMEIPFTVRDGFQYIGFVHAIQPMYGHLIHGKPIIGGYLARVPENIFLSYKSTKFLSYITKIIDKGNYNPLKEKPKSPNVTSFQLPLDVAKKELLGFNIGYILLKNNEKYTKEVEKILKNIGYKNTVNDAVYSLYEY